MDHVPPPPTWAPTLTALAALAVASVAAFLSFLAFRRDVARPVPELLFVLEPPGVEGRRFVMYGSGVSRREWARHPIRSFVRRRQILRSWDDREGELLAIFQVTNKGRRPTSIYSAQLQFSSGEAMILTEIDEPLEENARFIKELRKGDFVGRPDGLVEFVTCTDALLNTYEARVPKRTAERISRWLDEKATDDSRGGETTQ